LLKKGNRQQATRSRKEERILLLHPLLSRKKADGRGQMAEGAKGS